ncbi:transposase [Bradyrhizobium sp. JR4.1]
MLDLFWLREEVSDCYCANDGRPGIDPEGAVRLKLAGLLTGIVHDRKLIREAQVNIAISWFAGCGLHEHLPHHSSLAHPPALGEERFCRIFKRAVEACLNANIATAEVVHIDASLIRANVSWDRLTEQHVIDVPSEKQSEDEDKLKKKGPQSGKYKKICTTEGHHARNRRLERAYKQHTAVVTRSGSFWTYAMLKSTVRSSGAASTPRSQVKPIKSGILRVPTKPTMHSNLKPARYSNRKPATLGVNRMGRFDDVVEGREGQVTYSATYVERPRGQVLFKTFRPPGPVRSYVRPFSAVVDRWPR